MTQDISSFFDNPRKTLDWGRRAIKDFVILCRKYLIHHRNVIETDSNTGQRAVKFVMTKAMPDEIVEKATVAVQHIKNAYDQALYAACCAIGQRPTGSQTVNFPWTDSPKGLERRLTGGDNRKHGNIPDELKKIIRSFEPYASENNIFQIRNQDLSALDLASSVQ